MTEAQLQRAVVELARLLGWRVAHFRVAQTSKGWRTPVAADGAGWPDLFLVRDRPVAVELKTERGKLRPDQAAWLRALLEAGVETYLVRPHLLDQLATVLTVRRPGGNLATPRARDAEQFLLAELRKEIA